MRNLELGAAATATGDLVAPAAGSPQSANPSPSFSSGSAFGTRNSLIRFEKANKDQRSAP